MTWSAAQYTRFEDERTRPVRDLVAAIPRHEVRTAVDLGCGPGNSTEVLAARYPTADISGLDSSDDMIRAARERELGAMAAERGVLFSSDTIQMRIGAQDEIAVNGRR